jgi:hypothetical protein
MPFMGRRLYGIQPVVSTRAGVCVRADHLALPPLLPLLPFLPLRALILRLLLLLLLLILTERGHTFVGKRLH